MEPLIGDKVIYSWSEKHGSGRVYFKCISIAQRGAAIRASNNYQK